LLTGLLPTGKAIPSKQHAPNFKIGGRLLCANSTT